MKIVVTGASGGIGLQTVLSLAENHKNTIIAISRNIDSLIELKPNIIPIAYDLTQFPFDSLVSEISAKTNHQIDVLINNAGLLIPKTFSDTRFADFDAMMETNIKAPYFLIQSLLPLFSKSAHIVNISSMGGMQGSMKFTGLSAYSISKGALSIMTECLAEELKEHAIHINALCLGAVDTKMLQKAFPEHKAPLTAEEVGEFIAKFATENGKYFNGKIIPVSISTP